MKMRDAAAIEVSCGIGEESARGTGSLEGVGWKERAERGAVDEVAIGLVGLAAGFGLGALAGLVSLADLAGLGALDALLAGGRVDFAAGLADLGVFAGLGLAGLGATGLPVSAGLDFGALGSGGPVVAGLAVAGRGVTGLAVVGSLDGVARADGFGLFRGGLGALVDKQRIDWLRA